MPTFNDAVVHLEALFPLHRKVLRLSAEAFRLHVCGLCWSARYGTDGHVDRADLGQLSGYAIDDVGEAVAELQGEGLWELDGIDGSGWHLHDYLDYNPSAYEMQAARTGSSGAFPGTFPGTFPAGLPAVPEGRPEVPGAVPADASGTLAHHAFKDPKSKNQNPKSVSRPSAGTTAREAEGSRNSGSASGATSGRNSGAEPEGFSAWYSAYPRKEGKGAARTAYAKALMKVDGSVLLLAAQRYADDPNREPMFTKHPSTWLNQECWYDERLPPRRRSTPAEQREAMFAELAMQELPEPLAIDEKSGP